MKHTYAQDCQLPPFNWYDELTRVSIHDYAQLCNLTVLSRSWPSCACGYADARIPRATGDARRALTLRGVEVDHSDFLYLLKEGAPLDNQMQSLGVMFVSHVVSMEKSAARYKHNPTFCEVAQKRFEAARTCAINCLRLIEAREHEILKELGFI